MSPESLSAAAPYASFRIGMVTAVCSVPGFLVGAFAMWAAWQHNSQGEIHSNETGIDWPYWFFIGASWFIVVSGILLLVSFIFWMAYRFFCRVH